MKATIKEGKNNIVDTAQKVSTWIPSLIFFEELLLSSIDEKGGIIIYATLCIPHKL